MKMKASLAVLLAGLAVGLAQGGPGEGVVTSPGKPAHPISVELIAPKGLSAGETGEAELVVSTRVPLASVEVELHPAGGVTLAETRFSSRDGKFRVGAPLRMPFMLTASGGEARRLRVEVRAVTPEGNVITRDVELSARPERLVRQQETKRQSKSVQAIEPGEDVVVPAEQTIRD